MPLHRGPWPKMANCGYFDDLEDESKEAPDVILESEDSSESERTEVTLNMIGQSVKS
jgi:hypothetical protein